MSFITATNSQIWLTGDLSFVRVDITALTDVYLQGFRLSTSGGGTAVGGCTFYLQGGTLGGVPIQGGFRV